MNLLLGATDALCNGIVKVATGTNIAGLGKLVLGSTALTGSVTGSAALLLLSLACIAATVIVYVALVVRKVLIVVTAIFAPIAFAGSLADITVSWTRRWIETTIALIASKLILVIIFVAGYGILIEGVGQSGSGVTQKVTQVISGILVLFVAGLAPWLALKVVHFTGDHAQQLHSLGSSAVGGVAAGGRAAQKAAPYVARAAAMPAGGGAMAGGAAAGAGGAGAGGAAGAAGSSGGAPGLKRVEQERCARQRLFSVEFRYEQRNLDLDLADLTQATGQRPLQRCSAAFRVRGAKRPGKFGRACRGDPRRPSSPESASHKE